MFSLLRGSGCVNKICVSNIIAVEVCELTVDLLVELNSGFVKVDEHCHHCAINAVFSNYNVTSVVRAAVIGSVNLLAKVIF